MSSCYLIFFLPNCKQVAKLKNCFCQFLFVLMNLLVKVKVSCRRDGHSIIKFRVYGFFTSMLKIFGTHLD